VQINVLRGIAVQILTGSFGSAITVGCQIASYVSYIARCYIRTDYGRQHFFAITAMPPNTVNLLASSDSNKCHSVNANATQNVVIKRTSRDSLSQF